MGLNPSESVCIVMYEFYVIQSVSLKDPPICQTSSGAKQLNLQTCVQTAKSPHSTITDNPSGSEERQTHKCCVQVTGMTCASCVATIERNMLKHKGKLWLKPLTITCKLRGVDEH